MPHHAVRDEVAIFPAYAGVNRKGRAKMNKIAAHLKTCQKKLKRGIDWDDEAAWLTKRFRHGGKSYVVHVKPSNRVDIYIDEEPVFSGHLRLALMTFGD